MNLLEEIAAHLEWCGFGTAADAQTDGDIHWARMPDSPDDCVCVFSTDTGVGGADSVARIQIMCRARSPRAAYERACAIAGALDRFDGYLHGDGRLAHIRVMNAGTGLGEDTKKRELYVDNISVRYCAEE
ncbi:MAG: hypothetical protein IKP40_09010 [Clostridia bacterium]|nr:hypothetical protein [Clostridia bacterium]